MWIRMEEFTPEDLPWIKYKILSQENKTILSMLESIVLFLRKLIIY